MAKKLSGIRAVVRQFLRDEFKATSDYEFPDDEIDLYIEQCLNEVSQTCPYRTRVAVKTTASSRDLDISDIKDDLLRIDKVEFQVNKTPKQFRNFSLCDDILTVDIDASPSGGTAGTLAGTVTFTEGSAEVTGSGTAFKTELVVGYHIKKSTGERWYRVITITSDTALTLGESSRDEGADVVSKTQYLTEVAYIHCDKVHTLTESESTLLPQLERLLIKGVCGQVAIAKARTHINKVNRGGTRTSADMQTWGLNQLALYHSGLAQLTKPRIWRKYPAD